MNKCLNCKQPINLTSSRLIEDSCGHKKCRICLLEEEQGCMTCIRLKNSIDDNVQFFSELIKPLDVRENIGLHHNLYKSDQNFEKKVHEQNTVSNSKDGHILNFSVKTPKGCSKLRTNEQVCRSHIATLSGAPEAYQCTICGKTFRNKKSKCYHDVCVTGVKPYHCNICNRDFVKKSHFEYHERVHTGFKPFHCHLCSKAFPQKNKLNRHMLSHTHEKKFLCPSCGKRYSKKEDLKGHMYIHSGTLPYSCQICEKTFKMRANLKRHMHIHSGDRPFVCNHCSKSFKDKSLLVRHEKTHSKDRPYSCAHCNSLFISKSELMRHLAIHSDIKPFLCTLCNTSFRRKDNLTRHIRHHHSKSFLNCKNIIDDGRAYDNGKEKKLSVSSDEQKLREKLRPIINHNSTELKKNTGTVVKTAEKKLNNHTYQRINAIGNFIPVIRAPGESSNAVPVINRPINAKKLGESSDPEKLTHIRSIPCAAAVEINQRIEEKLYLRDSIRDNSYFFRESSNFQDSHYPILIAPPQRHVSLIQKDFSSQTTDNQNVLEVNVSTSNKLNLIKIECSSLKGDFEAVDSVLKEFGEHERSNKCTSIMD